jgi:hypothetical protein
MTGITFCGFLAYSSEYSRNERFWNLLEANKLLTMTTTQSLSVDPEDLERFLY